MRQTSVNVAKFTISFAIPFLPLIIWLLMQLQAQKLGFPDVPPYSWFYIPLWIPPTIATFIAISLLGILWKIKGNGVVISGLLCAAFISIMMAIWGINPPEPPDGGPGGFIILIV